MTKVLVVVAHPDDETIWMGGTIIRNNAWDWTISSLCRGEDPDRSPKFRRVCALYGAQAIINNLEDDALEPLEMDELTKTIKKDLPSLSYDYIFTHGENGEYGHIRHRETHQAVKKMVESGELKCKKLYFFSYHLGTDTVPKTPGLNVAIPNKNSDKILLLKMDEFKRKKEIIQKEYGFEAESFETLSCNKEETFHILK
jgi:LmbE family N-acetylglucosaminyl deacetylase